MTHPVEVRVPATIANMGPGFDSFGMAVGWHNRFVFEAAERDRLQFADTSASTTAGLSADPAKNILFAAMNRLYDAIGQTRPAVAITAEVNLPVARGLGSSSTAVVAGLGAANMMAGQPLDDTALLALAVEMEHHPDNVAPALLGGVMFHDGEKPYRLPWPESWRTLLIVPEQPVLTEEARKAMPAAYTIDDAVFNLRHASLLTYALLQADADAFRKALDDRLHQPYRTKLIPGAQDVRALAEAHGALGWIVSGSGSTMAVFCTDDTLEAIQTALLDFAGRADSGYLVKTVAPDTAGTVIRAL